MTADDIARVGAPALGVEERRDEAPRAGASHARPTPDCAILEEARELHAARRGGPTSRGSVSSHLTEWRRAVASRPDPEQTRSEARRAQSARMHERGESGSAGEGAAHRPYDPGRPGKSCRAAGIKASNTGRTGWPSSRSHRRSRVAPACRALGVLRASFSVVGGPLPGISSPVLRPPGPIGSDTARTSSMEPALRRPVTGRGSSRALLDEGRYLAPRGSARCTGYHEIGVWPRTAGAQSGVFSAVIPAARKPERWPRGPTRPGPGTSARCAGTLDGLLPGYGRDSFSPRRRRASMVADRENAALAATMINRSPRARGDRAGAVLQAGFPRQRTGRLSWRPWLARAMS